ncbi:MAG: hypothetical protein R3C19_25585 [Planctomycetaceae bacterium]
MPESTTNNHAQAAQNNTNGVEREVSTPNLTNAEYLAWISPDQMYDRDCNGHRRLSKRFLKWISGQPRPLTCSHKWLVSLVDDPKAAVKIRTEAANIADRDVIRNAKRLRANFVIEQAERDLAWLQKQRKWYLRALRFISPTVTRWEQRPVCVRSWQMVPHLLALVFWVVFFVMALVSELNNSVGLLMTAGMGFAKSALAALFSVFVVVATPFVSLKFLDATLQEAGRRTFESVLSIVAIPLSLVVIIFFSMTIGGSHGEVDLFAERSSWVPDYWVLYMFGMMGLAVTVLMIGKFLKKTLEHFYDFKSSPNPVCQAAKQQVTELNEAIEGVHADLSEAKRVLQELSNECASFEKQCCDDFDQLKRRLTAARAQLLDRESTS